MLFDYKTGMAVANEMIALTTVLRPTQSNEMPAGQWSVEVDKSWVVQPSVVARGMTAEEEAEAKAKKKIRRTDSRGRLKRMRKWNIFPALYR